MKQSKTTVRVKKWSINGQFLALKLEVIGPDPRVSRAPHRASISYLNKVTILMISYKATRNSDLMPEIFFSPCNSSISFKLTHEKHAKKIQQKRSSVPNSQLCNTWSVTNYSNDTFSHKFYQIIFSFEQLPKVSLKAIHSICEMPKQWSHHGIECLHWEETNWSFSVKSEERFPFQYKVSNDICKFFYPIANSWQTILQINQHQSV